MSTLYVSPTGSGDKSGSSWANAAPVTKIDSIMNKAGTGGTVLLAADQGAYHLTQPIKLTASGVTVSGMNTDGTAGDAVFEGTRPANWKQGDATGNEQFWIAKGANNLTFEHMTVNNTGTAFRVTGDVVNLTIQHVDANNVQRFLEDSIASGNKTASVAGLTVKDVDVEGYSKQAIHLKYDTSDVLIQDVVGNSKFQTGDNFAMGVHLEGTAHDVTFDRVTMENNATVNGETTDYWQGDGFSAERGTYDIHFIDTVSRGNTDGGYDIKSDDVTFERAMAENNGRNYRVWGDNVTITDSVGLDPHKRGGITTQSQLWVDSGAKNVKVVDSTFADSGSSTKAVVSGGDVTFVNTTISVAAEASVFVGDKPQGYAATAITKVAATGAASKITSYIDGSSVIEAKLPVHVTPTPTPGPSDNTDVTTTTPVKLPIATESSLTGDWLRITLTSGNDTIAATSKSEAFLIDQGKTTGADTIKGFSAGDIVVFTQKLGDADGDGITTFGSDKKLNFANGGTLSLDGVTGLRFLGQTADGYAYGNAKVFAAGSALPTVQAVADHVSTTANETWIGSNAKETFFFDNAKLNTGVDTIRSFGSDDVMITSKALADGNKDGLIAPGNDVLGLGNGAAGIKMPDTSKAGVRYLGQTSEGFVYADAAVRPKGALEGKLGTADTLAGGKNDTATDKFFFDTALNRTLGDDKVTNFGAKDVVVTTAKLGAGEAGTVVSVTGGAFALGHDGLDLGSLHVTDNGGNAVTSLEFDGDRVVNGVHYYVYSSVHSTVGTEAIG